MKSTGYKSTSYKYKRSKSLDSTMAFFPLPKKVYFDSKLKLTSCSARSSFNGNIECLNKDDRSLLFSNLKDSNLLLDSRAKGKYKAAKKYYRVRNYNKAIKLYKKALNDWDELEKDSLEAALVYYKLGVCYCLKGDLSESLKCHILAFNL
jgi:tetratricopeptide (TPR) repeat protein